MHLLGEYRVIRNNLQLRTFKKKSKDELTEAVLRLKYLLAVSNRFELARNAGQSYADKLAEAKKMV